MTHRSRPTVLMITLMAAVLAVLAGCERDADNSQAQSQQQPAQPVPVGVVQVQPRPVTVAESFVGRIEAIQNVQIRARVSGFLQDRLFEEGELVQTGKPLFRIERDTYEAIVEQRRADLAAAEAEAENARVQLQRARELSERDNIAQATVDERQAAARTAEASILQAKAALRQAEINLAYTEITSPNDGRIGRAQFDVGDLVGPESGAMAEIVSTDPIYVTFPVSQQRLLQAQREAGERGLDPTDFVVRLTLPDGSQYPEPGRVNFVGISVERGTDTVPVRATLANSNGLLRDGQFVQVAVEGANPEQAIVIPQSAVQADQQGNFVLGVTQDNKAEMRRIETGATLERGEVTVSSGLNPGDRIVVEGIQRVRPGAPVDPRPTENPASRV
jgi:membrane fusion protein, multidrug efflux system